MKMDDKHCLEVIREDLELLEPGHLRHIESCARCRAEYEIYQRLEQAIRNLPAISMPHSLRDRILNEILSPGYRMGHLFGALVLACCTPLMLLFFNVGSFFGSGFTLGLFGGSGVLIALLMVPITHYLLLRHRIDVDFLKHRIDELLEKRAF